MQDLTYEQTVELEENVKIKNTADTIYSNFLKNVSLKVENYKGNGRFVYWEDEHNATYFEIIDNVFYFKCDFLHETYSVRVTPSGIFSAIKNKNRGVDHLSSAVRNK